LSDGKREAYEAEAIEQLEKDAQFMKELEASYAEFDVLMYLRHEVENGSGHYRRSAIASVAKLGSAGRPALPALAHAANFAPDVESRIAARNACRAVLDSR
jgi:hypothetical protein